MKTIQYLLGFESLLGSQVAELLWQSELKCCWHQNHLGIVRTKIYEKYIKKRLGLSIAHCFIVGLFHYLYLFKRHFDEKTLSRITLASKSLRGQLCVPLVFWWKEEFIRRRNSGGIADDLPIERFERTWKKLHTISNWNGLIPGNVISSSL